MIHAQKSMKAGKFTKIYFCNKDLKLLQIYRLFIILLVMLFADHQ